MEIKGKKVFVVDSEDDSKGNLYWINFFDGKKHYSFKETSTAKNFLDTHSGIVFAVNLEYDIINIFRGAYDTLRWTFSKSRLISCRYKKLTFYDTYNHWKMSVEQIREFIRESGRTCGNRRFSGRIYPELMRRIKNG